MEIQHVTEKHLWQTRQQLINKPRIEIQDTLAIVSPEKHEIIRATLQKKHKEEMRTQEIRLVMPLDQKVADQQTTLEKAGVPGFYVTNNPLEVLIQMKLCDFIIRLSKMEIPS